MNDISFLNQFFFYLSVLVIGFLSFSVYLNNKKLRINQVFFLWSFFSLFWIIFGYFASLREFINLSLFFIKLRFAAVCFFIIFAYLFSVLLYKKEKSSRLLEIVIIFFTIFFFIASIFTDFIIKDVVFLNWGIEIIFGQLANIFYTLLFFITVLISVFLFRGYHGSEQREKTKVQYFLVGASIFILMNLIFNICIPLFLKTYKYYQFGDYSAIFLFAFTAYAIVKEKLFDIKIVLTALLVSFIAILISLDILIFTALPILQFFKVIGLITFLFLGRSLIVSVLKEEEMIEKMKKLNNDLVKANDELKELIEMKTSFLHIVSHQLRTPLTAMRGYISMWQEGDFDEYAPRKLAEVKKRIANNTERLNNLVNDMVVAMESEGGIKLNFEKVNIEEIIKNNIEFMKANYEKKKLYIRYRKTEKKLPKIEGDTKYLANAFMNLIDNAEKYTQKGGLKISIGRNGDNIILEFADTGVGINSEDRQKLFHKFVRGAASSLINPNGSGLGLYIIKQIIKQHHGNIEFKSEGEGKGTTFIVTLPIRQMASTSQGGAGSGDNKDMTLTDKSEPVKAESAERV